MRSLNPILVQFLYRSSIEQLPEKKREIYQYIERKEEELETIADDEKHFIQLMKEKSPFIEASTHFSLDTSTIKNIMDEAQIEIDSMIVTRFNKIKWIDYTDGEKTKAEKTNKEWKFIFMS